MDGLNRGMNASSSALRAERIRLGIAAQNIALSRTTRTPDGGPYQRKEVLFQAAMDEHGRPAGVEAAVVNDERTPYEITHDPSHPHADEEGNVKWPNVQLANEVVDLAVSKRAFEANATAFEALLSSLHRAIDLGRSS